MIELRFVIVCSLTFLECCFDAGNVDHIELLEYSLLYTLLPQRLLFLFIFLMNVLSIITTIVSEALVYKSHRFFRGQTCLCDVKSDAQLLHHCLENLNIKHHVCSIASLVNHFFTAANNDLLDFTVEIELFH